MRWKIILVNGGVVVVLALLTFFLLKTSLTDVLANSAEQRKELSRALQAADARLNLDALLVERWLDRQTSSPDLAGAYQSGTAAARSDSATAQANRLRDLAVAAPEFSKMAPSVVLLVDAEGVGLGRNGSELMRGDKLGEAYPSLLEAIRLGQTGSDLWINKDRQEQLMVAYAPVRDAAGQVLGAVVLGTPLNDERLKRTSELTSGRPLGLFASGHASPIAVAGAAGAQAALQSASAKTVSKSAAAGNLSFSPAATAGEIVAALKLSGYGSREAVLVASIPATRVDSVAGLLWPVFAVAALGLLLVVAGGVMLGNYISRPVAEIEEGLLLIINGQQDLRFDLEHEELGGLTSRINALLNTLLGVAEGESSTDNR